MNSRIRVNSSGLSSSRTTPVRRSSQLQTICKYFLIASPPRPLGDFLKLNCQGFSPQGPMCSLPKNIYHQGLSLILLIIASPPRLLESLQICSSSGLVCFAESPFWLASQNGQLVAILKTENDPFTYSVAI